MQSHLILKQMTVSYNSVISTCNVGHITGTALVAMSCFGARLVNHVTSLDGVLSVSSECQRQQHVGSQSYM